MATDAVVSDYSTRSKTRRAFKEQAKQNPLRVKEPSKVRKPSISGPVRKTTATSAPPKQAAPKTTRERIGTRTTKRPTTTRAIQGPRKPTIAEEASEFTTAEEQSKPTTSQAPNKSSPVQELTRQATPPEVRLFKQGHEDPENWPLDLSWMEREQAMFSREQKRDHLVRRPTAKTPRYMDDFGNPCFDNRYVQKSQRKPPIGSRHPKILQARKKGTSTQALESYWEQLSPKVNLPLAGTPSDGFANPKGGPYTIPKELVAIPKEPVTQGAQSRQGQCNGASDQRPAALVRESWVRYATTPPT